MALESEHEDQKDSRRIPSAPDGSFKRPPSQFRNFIQAGGDFPPEKGEIIRRRPSMQSLFEQPKIDCSSSLGRYHLYVVDGELS